MTTPEQGESDAGELHLEDVEMVKREVALWVSSTPRSADGWFGYAGDEYFQNLRSKCTSAYNGSLPSLQTVRMLWHAECGRLTGGDRALRKARHSTGTGSRPTSDGWGQPSEVLAEGARLMALCEGHGMTIKAKLQNLTHWSENNSEVRSRSTSLGLEVQNGRVTAVREGSPSFLCGRLKIGTVVRSVNGQAVPQDGKSDLFDDQPPSGEVVSLDTADSENETGTSLQLFRAELDQIEEQQVLFKHLREIEETARKSGNEELQSMSRRCKDLTVIAFQNSFQSELAVRARTQALQEESLLQLQHIKDSIHAVNMTVFRRLDDYRVVGNTEMDLLEADARRLKEELEGVQAELAASQLALQASEQSLKDVQDQLEKQKEMMAVEDQTVKEMSSLVATLKEERDMLSAKVKASHEDLIDVQTTISPLAKSKSWLEAQVDTLKSKVKTLEISKAGSLKDLNEAREELSAVSSAGEEKLAVMKRQMEREIEERKTGGVENQDLWERLRKAEADVEVKAGQIESLRAQLKANFIPISNDSPADEPERERDWVVHHLKMALPQSKDRSTQTDAAARRRSTSGSFNRRPSSGAGAQAGAVGEDSKMQEAFSSSMRKLSIDKEKLEQQLVVQLSELKSSAIEANEKVKLLEGENERLKRQLRGQGPASSSDDICGVGIVVEAPEEDWEDDDDEVVIKKVVAGGAAARSGCVEAGDRLLEVDGRAVQGMVITQLSELILGPSGTAVNLVLRSAVTQQPIAVSLVRSVGTEPRGGGGSTSDRSDLCECQSCGNFFKGAGVGGSSKEAGWRSPANHDGGDDASSQSLFRVKVGPQVGSEGLCDVCQSIRDAEMEVRRVLDPPQRTGPSPQSGLRPLLQAPTDMPIWQDDDVPVKDRIQRMVSLVCSLAEDRDDAPSAAPSARGTPEVARPLSFPSVSEDDDHQSDLRQQLVVMRMTEQLEAAQERIVELSVAVGRAEERREAQGERWKEKLALKDEEILRLRAHGEARGGSNLDHADSAGRVDVEMQREVERLRARVRELEADLAGLQADQARSGPGVALGQGMNELDEVQKRMNELELKCEELLRHNARLQEKNDTLAEREAQLDRVVRSLERRVQHQRPAPPSEGGGRVALPASRGEKEAQRDAEIHLFRLEKCATELEGVMTRALKAARKADDRERIKQRNREAVVQAAAEVERRLEESLSKVKGMGPDSAPLPESRIF